MHLEFKQAINSFITTICLEATASCIPPSKEPSFKYFCLNIVLTNLLMLHYRK